MSQKNARDIKIKTGISSSFNLMPLANASERRRRGTKIIATHIGFTEIKKKMGVTSSSIRK